MRRQFWYLMIIPLLFLSLGARAQKKVYYLDTTKVLLFASIAPDGSLDTVFHIKPRTYRTAKVEVYYDKKLKKKAFRCAYKNFNHRGIEEYWHRNGKVWKRMEVVEYTCHDTLISYDELNDTVQTITPLKPCKRVIGIYEAYYSNGQLKAKGRYSNNGELAPYKVGKWQYLKADGSPIKEENFNEAGKLHGFYSEAYANGKTKLSGQFWAPTVGKSLKDGTWRIFDLEGNLIKTREFQRGIEIKN